MKKGFTVLELLIVIAMIGIVAAVVLPALIPSLAVGQDDAFHSQYSRVTERSATENMYLYIEKMYPDAMKVQVQCGPREGSYPYFSSCVATYENAELPNRYAVAADCPVERKLPCKPVQMAVTTGINMAGGE